MKISVTQSHIDAGLRGSCSGDPVALAMKESGLAEPWVSPTELRWKENGQVKVVESPPEVLEFIRNFDNIRCVDTFDFELEG